MEKTNTNIDWDFILKLEGSKLVGYVPNYEDSKSGVTIASGFDLGARNERDLIGLPKNLIKKLTPYLELKGIEAHQIANNLVINDNEMKIINNFAKNKTMSRLKNRYSEATNRNFDDLPMHKATTIASVAFQYGNLESETPNFWKQVTTDDWDGATKNLQDFKDAYTTRRNTEADYLIKGEAEQKKVSPATIDTAQYQSNELAPAPELPGQITPSDSLSKIEAPEFPADPSALDPVPTSPASIDDGRKEMFTVGNKYDDPEIKTVLEDRAIPKYIPTHSITANEKKKYSSYAPIENKKFPKALTRKPTDSTYTRWDDFVNGFKIGPLDEIAEFTQDLGSKYLTKYAGYFAPGVPPIGSGEFPDEPIYRDETQEFIGDDNYVRMEDPLVKNDPFVQRLTIGSTSHEETISILKEITEDMKNAQRLAQSDSIAGTIGITAAIVSDPTLWTGLGAINMAKKAITTINRFGLGITYSVGLALPIEVIRAKEDPLFTGDKLAGHLAVHGLISASLSTFKIGRLKESPRIMKEYVNTSNILTHRPNLNNKKTTPINKPKSAYDNPKATNADFEDIEIIKLHEDLIKTSAYKKHVNDIVNYSKATKNNSYVSTDIKIERSSLNPTMRIMSFDPVVPGVPQEKIMMQLLVDTSAYINANKKGIATLDNAETIMDVTMNSMLHTTIFTGSDEFAKLWGYKPESGLMGNTKADFKIKLGIKGTGTAEYAIGRSRFNEDITTYLRSGEKHPVKEYETTINAYRSLYNDIDKMAFDSKIYQMPFNKKINALELSLKDITDVKKIKKIKDKIVELKTTIKDLHKKGPMQNNANNFFPRVYNHAAIDKNPEKFHLLMLKDTYLTNPNLSEAKANLIADQKTASILHNKGYAEINNSDDFVNEAFSTKSRVIQLADSELAPFLINDVEIVTKHYVKTMGMDIVLTNQFGDVTMKDALQNIRNQYDELILKTKDPEMKVKIEIKKQNSISDLQASRDRLRGTYGAPADPHALSSRIIRGFKSASVVTHMGGAAISSIPDMGMVIMRHGLKDFTEGFKALFLKKGGLNDLLKQMNRKEIRQVSQGAELILGLRQMATSDVGDIFQNRTKFEEVLHNSTNLMMLLNGLNAWNSIAKELVSQLVTNDISKLALKYYKRSNQNPIGQRDLEKLALSGIDLKTLDKIGKQIDKNHQLIDNSQYIVNTAQWDIADPQTLLKFRYALNLEIKRTIITPGAGDRALWTSKPLGTLIAQYKSFSQAFVQKVMIRGAQEKDINFATGIVSMVLIGALVVQLKRLINGEDLEEDYNELFYEAIIKSGVTGVFGDINSIAGVLTDGKLSASRLLGVDTGPTSFGYKVGTVTGPASQYLMKGLSSGFDLPFSSLPQAKIAEGLIKDD